MSPPGQPENTQNQGEKGGKSPKNTSNQVMTPKIPEVRAKSHGY